LPTSFKSFFPAAVWQYVQPFPSFFVYSAFPKEDGEDMISPPKMIANGTPILRIRFDIGYEKSPHKAEAIRTPLVFG
jgi:hypothetical protein